MFGLDERIASYSNGTTLLIVLGVSVLLGLRHASDPDHREHDVREPARKQRLENEVVGGYEKPDEKGR